MKSKKRKTASTTAHAANVDCDKRDPSQHAELLNAMIREGQDATRRCQQLMAATTQFGRSLVEGKVSMKGLIEFYRSIPPELRPGLSEKFPELFGAENFAEFIKLLENLHWLETAQPDSRSTPFRAVVEQFRKITGCNILDFAKSLSAFMQIRRELAGGPRANAALLKAYDDFHVGQFRVEGQRKQALHALADRLKLAAIRDDIAFIERVCEELKKKSSILGPLHVKDFGLGSIQKFLLENWDCIHGWEPNYGLCHFSRKGLRDYCEARLDPDKKRERPITEDAVEGARKRRKLHRSKPLLVKDARLGQLPSGKPDSDAIILRLKKGGPIIHKRVSTL